MKRLLIVLVVVFATLALGQHNQFNPVVDNPVEFAQVSDSDAYVAGNWVALDEHSKLPGVSVSEIRCDRAEKVCHELQANLIFVGSVVSGWRWPGLTGGLEGLFRPSVLVSLSCGDNLVLTLLEAIQITIAASRTQTLQR